MASQSAQSCASSSFACLIDDDNKSIDYSDSLVEEKSDSDASSDHFSESKGMSSEDFCKSINSAANGLDIFDVVYDNLAWGIFFFLLLLARFS